MFRKGTFVRQTVLPGATQIPVYSRDAFTTASSTSPIPIVIMNTPALHTDTANYNPADAYYEHHLVIGTGGTKKNPTLVLSQPLAKQYTARFYPANESLPAGAAVGICCSGPDLYPIDETLGIELLKEAYVNNVTLGTGANPLPYIPAVDECGSTTGSPYNEAYCHHLATRSFNNFHPQYFSGGLAKDNHHHLTSSSKGPAGWLGVAHMRDHAYCASAPPQLTVFHRRIEELIANSDPLYVGLSPTVVNREVTAHEMVHLFDVNQAQTTDKGHCNSNAWDAGHCLMNPNRQNAERGDDHASLHVDPWDTSEYRRIRRQTEPLPQQYQSTFLPNP